MPRSDWPNLWKNVLTPGDKKSCLMSHIMILETTFTIDLVENIRISIKVQTTSKNKTKMAGQSTWSIGVFSIRNLRKLKTS
jgi:hypothetical protein